MSLLKTKWLLLLLLTSVARAENPVLDIKCWCSNNVPMVRITAICKEGDLKKLYLARSNDLVSWELAGEIPYGKGSNSVFWDFKADSPKMFFRLEKEK